MPNPVRTPQALKRQQAEMRERWVRIRRKNQRKLGRLALQRGTVVANLPTAQT